MTFNIVEALMGGALIGVAVSVMLIFNGRVTGISGILNGFLSSAVGHIWRGPFLLGLVFGGFVMSSLNPDFFKLAPRSTLLVVIAGFLVGFGTVMGSGCTSGHGVCGISRLSLRSLTATMIFIVAGVVVGTVTRYIWGLQ